MPPKTQPTAPPMLEEYEKPEVANDATYIGDHLLTLARQLIAEPQSATCRFKKIEATFRHRVGPLDRFGCYHYVPEINLVGLWLHEAGFMMGNYSRIYTFNTLPVISEPPHNSKSAPMMNLYKPH